MGTKLAKKLDITKKNITFAKKNMVSIIIPVFQAAEFLEETIKSVINQTYKQWELILVDDGSTDVSGDICDKYALNDCRIHAYHKKNGGQSSARNYGLSLAKGQYIYMMDNDDTINVDAISTLVYLIEEYHTDIAACSYNVINENGIISHSYHSMNKFYFNNQQGMEHFLDRTIDVYVWTKMYKKEFLFENNILFEEKRSDEDFLFNIQTFHNANSIIYYDYPIYLYKERINSTCRQFPQKKLHKYIEDTLYRTKKIEQITKKYYPQQLYLAKRQTIDYMFRLIGAIIKNNVSYKNSQFYTILKNIKNNRRQAIKERYFWKMSHIGVLLATTLHPYIYFLIRKYAKHN